MTTETLPPAAEPITVASVAVPVVTDPSVVEEREVFRVRMSMTRRYPLRCVAYAALILTAAGLATWAFYEGYSTFGVLVSGFGAFLAARFAYWYLKTKATALVVTTKRVVLESGVLSRVSSEFTMETVADIQVDQGLTGKMLGVGDLVILSVVGDEKKQMVVMAVPDPVGVAEQIRTVKG